MTFWKMLAASTISVAVMHVIGIPSPWLILPAVALSVLMLRLRLFN